MHFAILSQTSASLTEDVTAKFNTLYQSNEPFKLITDCANVAIAGAQKLKAEEVLIPLGCGTLSLYTAIQNGQAAIHRFANGKLMSGLFHASIAGFAGFVAVYNLNNLANVTYAAGSK